MIIDSSVLVAIALEEAEYPSLIEKIAEAVTKRMSSASLLETSIVVNRKKGYAAVAVLDAFLVEAGIQVVDFSAEHARIAFDAYRRFGKGMGHRAQMNILDCCTYALALQTGEPVFFKGSDFSETDVAIVT